jgi:hypothetical protein
MSENIEADVYSLVRTWVGSVYTQFRIGSNSGAVSSSVINFKTNV